MKERRDGKGFSQVLERWTCEESWTVISFSGMLEERRGRIGDENG